MTLASCLSLTSIVLALSFAEVEVREAFHKEALTKEDLQSIIEKGASSESVLVQAYVGLCETMLAEHVFLPTTKFTYFSRGKAKIERAISEYPESAEIRYIRLMVQLNIPSLLGYSENVNYDLEIFTKNIGNMGLSAKWKQQFITELVSSRSISEHHRSQLRNLKTSIAGEGQNTGHK